VGFLASLFVLVVLGIMTTDTGFAEALGTVTLQAVPGSIGAVLARTLLGGEHADQDRPARGAYAGELFIMATGALFLSLSIAPTEEVIRIAVGLHPWRTALLVLLSLVLMHAFVYAVEFHGTASRPESASGASEFVRLTVAGYALALVISAYVLWTFGRTDGLATVELLRSSVVLAFPASIGAAAARLIL
jgi:putative integral membrane protein (TIGR02587 family)